MGWDIAVVAVVLIGYAAVSGRLHGSVITPALVFVVAGYVLGEEALGLFGADLDSGTVRLLAEITLALVLFTDASALDTRLLSKEAGLPVRLLAIGLPLSILLGTLIAVPMFPDLSFFEAAVIAVLLAPTDAALGQTVISDQRLPSRLRQGLNTESGLNDGVCVPLLFGAVAFAELEEAPTFDGEILRDLVVELGIATAVGLAAAMLVALVVSVSNRRNWLDEQWAQVVPLATAGVAYAAAAELGGSGFIATFVAGLAYGRLLGTARSHESTKLMEEFGGLLSAITFFVFGAIVIGRGIVDLDLATVAYAVLSLTVVRMVPVALSLVGSGAAWPTSAFAGWFGPRGLATIVFMLTVVEESDLAGSGRIVQVATMTVVLSVIAHGVTAPSLTDRYVRWLEAGQSHLDLESREAATTVGPIKRGLWQRRPRQPS